jgi:transglutaminase-like putative cysteine protease
MQRSVTAHLVYWVEDAATLELQIGVAAQYSAAEQLAVTFNGVPVEVEELTSDVGTRHHLVRVREGQVEVQYSATIAEPAPAVTVEPLDLLLHTRPSRYCESDELAGFAAAEFRGLTSPMDLLPAVSSWVGDRLEYVPGSSGPTDGAVATLLTSRGVCRDYAHLTVALLRARGVPARVAAVYAPGLWPMDFHAVAEAVVDGVWRVVDPSLLAPRSSLVRIATGRDASDTAFLTNHGGTISLVNMEVGAVVDGWLPSDDVTELVSIT